MALPILLDVRHHAILTFGQSSVCNITEGLTLVALARHLLQVLSVFLAKQVMDSVLHVIVCEDLDASN